MSLQVWIPFISTPNNQGLCQNAVTSHNLSTYSAGKFGTAAQFNGSSTYVNGTVYTTATMTYMMWFYLDTLKGCHILDCRQSEAGYQPIYLNPTSGIQVGGSTSAFIYLPYTFTAGTWYHIAVTYSATKCQLFVNGELAGETTSAKGTNINAIKPFYIGCRHTQSNWFHGRINDFRIYDHTCSKKEIALVAQGLFRHYKLDSVQGTKICDCAGYGYHGTMNGTLTLSTSTGRYSKSMTTSDGSTNYITAPTMPDTCQTLSLWAKIDTSNAQVLFADYGSNLLIAYWKAYDKFLVAPNNLSGYAKPAFDASSLIAGGWNHLVLVKVSNSEKKFYINGVEITAGTPEDYYTQNAGDLMIFRRNYNTTASVVNSSISDVRVYVTPLTTTQIQWLYKEGAAVDSSGNVYAAELIDDSTAAAPAVKKTGTLIGKTLSDGFASASVTKQGIVKANSLFEY